VECAQNSNFGANWDSNLIEDTIVIFEIT